MPKSVPATVHSRQIKPQFSVSMVRIQKQLRQALELYSDRAMLVPGRKESA